jgi:hypothetical protein
LEITLSGFQYIDPILRKINALAKQIGYKPIVINGYVNIASVYNKPDQPTLAMAKA